jgi:hypothetical protein
MPDQLWGIIARKIATAVELHTPECACRVIRNVLDAPSIRAWIGTTTRVEVNIVPVVRNWRDHLPLLHVELKGGLLVDVSANHLFFFMRYGGALPAAQLHSSATCRPTAMCLLVACCCLVRSAWRARFAAGCCQVEASHPQAGHCCPREEVHLVPRARPKTAAGSAP